MFGKKVEKALSDWPKDKINPQKGTLQIVGQYATPTTGQNVAILSAIFAIPLAAFTAGIGIIFLIPLVPFLWMMFQKNLSITMNEETIRVNGKRYNRQMPIEFRVDNHQKAHRDNPGVYRTALEVVMQYGERRIPVAAMRHKDVEKANALQLRLQSWHAGFSQIMASYQGGPSKSNVVEGKKDDFGPPPDVV